MVPELRVTASQASLKVANASSSLEGEAISKVKSNVAEMPITGKTCDVNWMYKVPAQQEKYKYPAFFSHVEAGEFEVLQEH